MIQFSPRSGNDLLLTFKAKKNIQDFVLFRQDNKFLDDLEKQREKAKRRESGSSDRSPTSSASSAMIHRAGNERVVHI